MLTLASAYDFGDALLTVVEIALFVAWLVILWQVLSDLFLSHDLSGVAKASWVIALFVFPLLGSLIYLLFRGGEMHERRERAAIAAQRAHTGTPLGELERLAALHRQGSLSDDEFQRAKDRYLGS